jgi:hypothetical protein
MSSVGYIGPTVEGILQTATVEVFIPALALLVPLWVLARTLRHHHTRRTFGTAHLTQSQNLALDRSHSLLRRLSHATTSIVIVLGALLIQNGIVREFGPTGVSVGGWWQSF